MTNNDWGRDYPDPNFGRDYAAPNFGRSLGGQTNVGRDFGGTNFGMPSGSAVVVVTPTSPPVVLPLAAVIAPGATQQFLADSAVTWSVVGGAANGSITNGGLYTAPATPGTYTVRATAVADPTKYTNVIVSVVAAYWMDSAYDSRLPVSVLNSSGVNLHDHLVAVTVPVDVTIDSNSLRVVETTTLGSIDRAYDWRYAPGSTSLNHMPFLPAKQSGGVVTFKALGRWPTAQSRTFNLYWNAAGGIAAPNFNHLGAIAPGWTVALTAGTTGDSYTIVAGGATYTHVMTGGQTAAQIGTALAVLINAGAVATATGTSTLTIRRVDLTSLTFTVANTGSTVPGNLVVTKPLFWTVARNGPDTAVFTPATYAFGVPYGVSSGVATRPMFGKASTLGVRLMQYRVNGDGAAYGAAAGTITSYTNNGPDLSLAGSVTFDTRSAGVDWAATWTASHRQRVLVGRKSDDTGANTLNKYVDVQRITLVYTCQRTYAPTTILSSVTSTSNFDLITLGSTVNVFTSNVTEAAGNKIANFSAPLDTGVISSFAASANLSALPVVGTILGTHGNTSGAGVLVNSIAFANFTANPTPKWAANGNPFAILQLVNVSNAVSIPAGATITIDFWHACGFTNNATTTGDNLLPDELVALMRNLSYEPTVTISAAQTYSSDSLAATMALAASRALDGVTYIQTNALAYTTVARGYTFARQAITGTLTQPDDDDGSYGNAFSLAGLCLRYKRTHDASLIALIENQVQFHIDIEAAAVSLYGTWWEGSVPYWFSAVSGYTGATTEGGCTEWHAVSNNDPTLIDPVWAASYGSAALGPITYSLGQVRRKTSIDQIQHVAMALYHYLVMLDDESAITANTTLRTNALALLSRMVTFEAAHYVAAVRVCGNLYAIASGGTASYGNGVTTGVTNAITATVMADPYYPGVFKTWQVDNGDNLEYSPAANTALLDFFRGLYAPNSINTAVVTLMRGWGTNMLTANYGYHDVTAGANMNGLGVQGAYLPGWHGRPNAVGNTVQYENPRTSASNNGFSTDKHLFDTNSGGARDHLNGRGAHRACALAIAALLDPGYSLPVEMNSSTVLRSVSIQTALDADMRTMANYLIEPTTKMQRLAVAGYFGKSSSYDPQVVDSAYTGYWMMATELWFLLQARIAGTIDVADYYRFPGEAYVGEAMSAQSRAASRFPVGVFDDLNITNTAPEMTDLVADVLAQGMDSIFFTNGQTSFHEPLLDVSDGSGVDVVYSLYGDLATPWWDTAVTDDSVSNAQAQASAAVSVVSPHSSLLGYTTIDDATISQHTKLDSLNQAVLVLDPLHPVMHILPSSGTLPALFEGDGAPTVNAIYRYPCTNSQAECDFYRMDAADWVSPYRSFVRDVRERMRGAPEGMPTWIILQTHTTGATPDALRVPSVAEMKMQFWLAIGEGVKGIYWFIYSTEQMWIGLQDDATLFNAAGALAARIAPFKESVLLYANKTHDRFTATGSGGNEPYTGTLLHEDGTYYVVVVNQDASTRTISIARDDALGGTLYDLEAGTSHAQGAGLSYTAGNGRIFRLVTTAPFAAVTPPASTNLITNGTFVGTAGATPTGWSGSGNGVNAVEDGFTCMRMPGSGTGSAGDQYRWQMPTVVADQSYRLSCRFKVTKANAAGAGVQLRVLNGTPAYTLNTAPLDGTRDWYEYECYVHTSRDYTTGFRVDLHWALAGSDVGYVTDVECVAVDRF